MKKDAKSEIRLEATKTVLGLLAALITACCVLGYGYLTAPGKVIESNLLLARQLTNQLVTLERQYSLDFSNQLAVAASAKAKDLEIFSALLEKWHSNSLAQIEKFQLIQLSNILAQAAIEHRDGIDRQATTFSNRLAEIKSGYAYSSALRAFGEKEALLFDVATARAHLDLINRQFDFQKYYLAYQRVNFLGSKGVLPFLRTVYLKEAWDNNKALSSIDSKYDGELSEAELSLSKALYSVALAYGSESRAKSEKLLEMLKSAPPTAVSSRSNFSSQIYEIVESNKRATVKRKQLEDLENSMDFASSNKEIKDGFAQLYKAMRTELEMDHHSLVSTFSIPGVASSAAGVGIDTVPDFSSLTNVGSTRMQMVPPLVK